MKLDLRKIYKLLMELIQDRFHGKVILSYNDGKITNVRKEHSLPLEIFQVDDNG